MRKTVLACMLITVLAACDKDFRLFRYLDNATQQSQCGGFEVRGSKLEIAKNVQQQCRDEKLLWKYSRAANTVTFIHKNIWTDCAKEISSTVSQEEENTYMIEEVLAGEPTDCLCLYDIWNEFTVDNDKKITLKLLYDGNLIEKDYYNAMDNANKVVLKAENDLSNGRMARNTEFYAPTTGLTEIGKGDKLYIKAVFGANSPQYNQVAGIGFVTYKN